VEIIGSTTFKDFCKFGVRGISETPPWLRVDRIVFINAVAPFPICLGIRMQVKTN
jgi:hypothetical protein